MRRGRFTEDQIIGVLREHEAGVKTAELCRKHGISPRQRPQPFKQERHLVDRETYKARRSAALAEWQVVMS